MFLMKSFAYTWVGGRAYWEKVRAEKPDHLSSVPETDSHGRRDICLSANGHLTIVHVKYGCRFINTHPDKNNTPFFPPLHTKQMAPSLLHLATGSSFTSLPPPPQLLSSAHLMTMSSVDNLLLLLHCFITPLSLLRAI